MPGSAKGRNGLGVPPNSMTPFWVHGFRNGKRSSAWRLQRSASQAAGLAVGWRLGLAGGPVLRARQVAEAQRACANRACCSWEAPRQLRQMRGSGRRLATALDRSEGKGGAGGGAAKRQRWRTAASPLSQPHVHRVAVAPGSTHGGCVWRGECRRVPSKEGSATGAGLGCGWCSLRSSGCWLAGQVQACQQHGLARAASLCTVSSPAALHRPSSTQPASSSTSSHVGAAGPSQPDQQGSRCVLPAPRLPRARQQAPRACCCPLEAPAPPPGLSAPPRQLPLTCRRQRWFLQAAALHACPSMLTPRSPVPPVESSNLPRQARARIGQTTDPVPEGKTVDAAPECVDRGGVGMLHSPALVPSRRRGMHHARVDWLGTMHGICALCVPMPHHAGCTASSMEHTQPPPPAPCCSRLPAPPTLSIPPQAALPAGACRPRRGARQPGQQEPRRAGPAGARHEHAGGVGWGVRVGMHMVEAQARAHTCRLAYGCTCTEARRRACHMPSRTPCRMHPPCTAQHLRNLEQAVQRCSRLGRDPWEPQQQAIRGFSGSRPPRRGTAALPSLRRGLIRIAGVAGIVVHVLLPMTA